MRKSQLTALLLSLTLSGVGAANYYIGQNVLAGTQLALLLLVIVGVAGGLGLFYCSISKLEFKQEKNMVTDVGLLFIIVIIYFKFTFLEIIYFCLLNGERWGCCTSSNAFIASYRCMVDC